MQKEKVKREHISSSQALPIGLALIAPLLLLVIYTHFLPLTNVFSNAMTSNNLLRGSEYIGMENFSRMAEDERFLDAIGNTIPYVIQRSIIAVIVPLLIGGLIGLQAKTGRLINRGLLGLLAVLIFPVGLSVIWSIYWSPNWGINPSPIFNEDYSLMSPDGASSLLETLDMMLMFSTAAVVGGTMFIAVMRGQRRAMTGIAVGLIGFIVAGASGWLVFDLPFVLTNGGPANATSTYMLSVYQSGFQSMRIGYASAQAVPIAVGALIIGLIIGVITIGFNLRVIQVSRSEQAEGGNNMASLASVPLIIILLVSLGGYLVWALTFDSGMPNEGRNIDEMMPIGQGIVNSLSPLFAIWFIQLPFALMAGLGLGFYRPFGKIGSNILFVILLMIMLVPTEALMFEWFIMSREIGMLNNVSMLGFPWMVNGFTLLAFKVFADGARDHFYQAMDTGMSSSKAFGKYVMMPAMLIALVAGVILSFLSIQSFLWALISQNSRENFTIVIQMIMMRMQLAMEVDAVTGLATNVIIGFGVIFAILFIAIQIFVLERFALASSAPLEMDVEDYASDDPVVDHDTDMASEDFFEDE